MNPPENPNLDPSPLPLSQELESGKSETSIPENGNGKYRQLSLPDWQREFGTHPVPEGSGPIGPPPMPELSMEIAILQALSLQASRKQPMRLRELCQVLSIYRVSEEQLRERIDGMRRRGYLIGSTWGTDGGYYLIRSMAELDEFAHLRPGKDIERMRQMLESGRISELMQHSEVGAGEIGEEELDEILLSIEKILAEKEA